MFCNSWFYINNVWVFKSFSLLSNYFWLCYVYWLCVFLSYILLTVSLPLRWSDIFSVNLIAKKCRSFFVMVYWVMTVILRKSSFFITFFKVRVSDFIDWHIFYGAGNIEDIHYYIRKTKKVKKRRSNRDEKIAQNVDNE